MALRCDLHKSNCVGEFKGKGNGRVFGNDQKMTLGDLKGQGDEAIQERWIENQVKLRAQLLLEMGLIYMRKVAKDSSEIAKVAQAESEITKNRS